MQKIINISEAVTIAVHSLVIIAGSNTLVNGTKVAEITGFSRNHLSKVMQLLVRHHLLKSVRGPKGGFLLNQPAEKIYLMDVYKIVEGDIQESHTCLHTAEDCPFSECIFGGITDKLSLEFIEYLNNKTIKDLIKIV